MGLVLLGVELGAVETLVSVGVGVVAAGGVGRFFVNENLLTYMNPLNASTTDSRLQKYNAGVLVMYASDSFTGAVVASFISPRIFSGCIYDEDEDPICWCL